MINAVFENNYVKASTGSALGGAIYTANNLNFINNNSSKQLLIKDNYVIDSTGKNANAIFVDTVSGRKSLDFNLTNNSETIISDSIDGGRYDFINNNVQRGIVEIDGETVDTRYNISINGDKTSKITSVVDVASFFNIGILFNDVSIDEFVIFTNVLSTIIRQRDDVKIFMLGNTVNQYSPYFTEMGLTNVRKMKPGDIEVYSYDDKRLKVAVEYTEPSATTKKSNFYFAFNNPKLNMIKNGSWEFANYPHCPMKYRPADIALAFFIKWEEDILQCEIVIVNDSYFIFIHKKTTPLRDTMNDLIYSVDYSPRPNYKRNILKPMSYIEKQIYKLFAEYKVFYQDNQVGEIVRNYLQWCKQN